MSNEETGRDGCDSGVSTELGNWQASHDLACASALVFGDLVEDRLPRLLLLVNEGGGLGGRHRIGVAP